MKIRKKIRNWSWGRSVRKSLKMPRQKRSMALSEAHSVGIYAEYKDAQSLATLEDFASELSKNGLSVYILLYTDAKEKLSENIFKQSASRIILCRKDIGFNHCPKQSYSANLEKFLNKKFDLFLNLSQQFHYLDIWISARNRATFKIGKDLHPYSVKVNDFILSLPHIVSVEEYLNLLRQHIEKFKSQ